MGIRDLTTWSSSAVFPGDLAGSWMEAEQPVPESALLYGMPLLQAAANQQ